MIGRFLVKRFLGALPVLVGVATLVFLLIHFIPGDPIDLLLGDTASPEDRNHLREQLGLNWPLWKQYLLYWKHVFDGSWGQSLTRSASVLSLILDRFPATLGLAFSSLWVACVISFPLGVYAAKNAGRWPDSVSTALALVGVSVPIFVLAPLAVLFFSIRLRWLPVAGSGSFGHWILPSLCLGGGLAGILTRMIRTSVLECLSEDFVRTARSKGLSETKVLFRHTLRNAFIPVLTVMGNMLGGLLAGAVLTETLFDWPGLGKLFYSAFRERDYPLIQGIVLWIAVSYSLINIGVDFLYSVVDPRVRLEG